MKINTGDQSVYLGPPGSGKTTTIISLVKECLETHESEHIALVSFTRKAVNEAIERVTEKFSLERDRFPLFQTVHAMCYRALGCSKNDMMTRENFQELGTMFGYELTLTGSNMEDGILILPDRDKGSKLLFLDNLSRIRCESLKDTWRTSNANIPFAELERFSIGYTKYRKQTGKKDFTDLLSAYLEECLPLPVSAAFIDEAQDLSALQWKVLQKAFSEAEQVFVAGDDDQSIFKWSGADLNTFLELDGEKIVLDHSYRLPQAVHAKAQTVIGRVRRRYNKLYTATKGVGKVQYLASLGNAKIIPEEKTLILARNVYMLKAVYEELELRGLSYTGRNGFKSVDDDHLRAIKAWERVRKGDTVTLDEAKIVYQFLRVGVILSRGGKATLNKLEREDESFSWETLRDHYGLLEKPVWQKALVGIPLEKRQYYIGMLRRKQKLSENSNLHVNTIHGVKGGEADHVIVLSDMSRQTHEEFLRDPCSEHRVFYVAVTRSKDKLTIILPQGKYGYQI